jgi:hypothetical protein
LKEEALDRNKWRNRFGRRCGPVVWQITDEWIYNIYLIWLKSGSDKYCWYSATTASLKCVCFWGVSRTPINGRQRQDVVIYTESHLHVSAHINPSLGCTELYIEKYVQTVFLIYSFTPQSFLRQIHSLFLSQFSTHCDLVLPLSIFGILSFS